MRTVAVIGAGVAGLHFALYLQKHGLDVTLFSERTLEEMRGGRLPNTVALMPTTRGHDRDLGTDHWTAPELGTGAVEMRVAGDFPIAFRGETQRPMLFIDMRVYLPTLAADFAGRGGKIVHAAPTPAEVAALAGTHDLVVVASGRAGLTGMFERMPEHSPYEQPQRRLFAGLFRGIRLPRPFTMGFHILPGIGEIFENQFLSLDGHVAGLLVEAIPGGPLETVTRLRYEDDPAAFDAALLAMIREYLPETHARTDAATFGLTRPLDTLSGAVTPVVRRGLAALGGGRFALALGDTHITHDPLTGQGANAASRAARLLGEMVVEQSRAGGAFDEAFGDRAERHIRDELGAVTMWSNAFLQPPPPHVIGMLVASAQNQALANSFVTNFDDPKRVWSIISNPAATEAYVNGFHAPS